MAKQTLDRHTGISIGLVISLAGSIAGGFWWASAIETRLESAERQNKSQWERMSRIQDIRDAQLRMEGELKALRGILEK